MDLSRDTDEELRARFVQLQKELGEARARVVNREGEELAIKNELERRAEATRITSIPPVDRSARILTSGEKETDRPDYRELTAAGMQQSYVVLTEEERAKGFVRPVRRTYIHVGRTPKMNGIVLIRPGASGIVGTPACGTRTTMAVAIAETYARDPQFYSGTFCATCRKHLPLDEFVWEGTDRQVGS